MRGNSAGGHRYRYNDKELVSDLNLNWYDYGARWYDPAIGRWNAVDPLADVYPSFSTFGYVLNNPISLIDPDGRRVIIPEDDDADFQRTAFNALQKLSSNQLVLLNSGEVVVNSGDINSNDIKVVGNVDTDNQEDLSYSTGIVGNLISDEHTTSILKGDRNRAEAADNSKAWKAPDGDGSGSDATVYFNPDDRGSRIPNNDGTAGRPNFVGLGHELIHASDITGGNSDPTGYDATVPVIFRAGGEVKYIRVPNFPQNEISTYQSENRIRSQYKIPGRRLPTVRGLAPASVYEKQGYYVPKRNRGN